MQVKRSEASALRGRAASLEAAEEAEPGLDVETREDELIAQSTAGKLLAWCGSPYCPQ